MWSVFHGVSLDTNKSQFDFLLETMTAVGISIKGQGKINFRTEK